MAVTIKPVIQRAWMFINNNDRLDKAFNIEKAYVSSLFCSRSLECGQWLWSGGIVSHSCYTFGMPRFGDQHAVGTLWLPYHIENDRDDIPTAPPTALGYAGMPAALILHGHTFPYLAVRKRQRIPAITLLLSLPMGPIVNHYMALYIDQVAQKVTNAQPCYDF